jgi:hypothetical protein
MIVDKNRTRRGRARQDHLVLSPNWQETPKFPNEGAGQFVSTEQTPYIPGTMLTICPSIALATNDSGRNQNGSSFLFGSTTFGT